MLIVQTRSFPLLKITEIWFDEGALPSYPGKTIYYQSLTKPEERVYYLKEFHTLALPLSEPVEQLTARINRTFRYHIRKGESLRLEYCIFNLETEKNFRFYLKSFNQFATRKNLIMLPEWRLKHLVKSQSFTVSLIKRGDNYINMHGYVHDGIRARLVTSHPMQHHETESVQGYINKFHHWRDILFFKEHGYHWYDFGGVSANQDDGRSYFKQSFGGEPQVFYNFIRCTGAQKWLFEIKDFYERFF